MAAKNQLRELPAVDQVLSRLAHLEPRFPRRLIVEEVRRTLADVRDEIRAGRHDDDPAGRSSGRSEPGEAGSAFACAASSMPPAWCCTPTWAARRFRDFEPLFGYSNLEYDLARARAASATCTSADLLERLIGAPGIAVNNNAAAIYLALNELAAGFEVVVSRGELIEIGDGFRIPDIMQRSGAILREVGTTNRTRIEDYRDAINERTRLLLRVHPSNFRIEGFTARPALDELVALGRERGIPVYEDLGSGCVADLRPFGIQEPLVADSLRAGVEPGFIQRRQVAGRTAGRDSGGRRGQLVARLRRNPMFRALRLDKLIYQALETTLRNLLLERWDQIPALRMISQSRDELRIRSERFVGRLDGLRAEVIEGSSLIGGGATPEQPLQTWLIAIDCADVVEAEKRCRLGDPPVIARIENGRLTLDLRTVFPAEEELAGVIINATTN